MDEAKYNQCEGSNIIESLFLNYFILIRFGNYVHNKIQGIATRLIN